MAYLFSELVRAIRLRPETYIYSTNSTAGPPTFDGLCNFLMGAALADADQPLLGFEEWLGEKYGVSNPFVWPLFVHRLFRGVDGVKPEAEVSSQTDLAFDLLDEFLLERSSDVS